MATKQAGGRRANAEPPMNAIQQRAENTPMDRAAQLAARVLAEFTGLCLGGARHG